MNRVPLNVFQKTQRLWETFHPYNAAQVMHLAGEAELPRIAEGFVRVLQTLGLGFVVTDGETYGFHEAGATASTANVFLVRPRDQDDDRSAIERLMSHLSREMNRHFSAADGATQPFRPFVVRDRDSYHVGLVYQHWVADSVSIRLLMREWLLSILRRPAARTTPLRLARRGMLHHFGPGSAGWSAVGAAAGTLAFASRMKAVRRVSRMSLPGAVAVHYRRLPDGLITPLKRYARRHGATVGDVFTAAAVMACAAHGAGGPTQRRPDLAFGSIVDLRARSTAIPGDVFGLFLGFVATAYRAGELRRFENALAAAARQSRFARATRAAEAGQVRLAIGLQLAKRLSPDQLREFYRKRFPLSGGLSSVNLANTWQAEFHPAPLLQYLRVSPTGPLMPVVFTPTTLGDTLHVCCTVRSDFVDPSPLLDTFCDRLVSLYR